MGDVYGLRRTYPGVRTLSSPCLWRRIVQSGGLTLTTLHPSEEVRPVPSVFSDLAGRKSADELVKVAEQLIEKKSETFDPAEWRDRYQAGLQELIEAKLAGMPAPEHRIAPTGTNVIN